ncbi:hypothetical protein P879_11426 [Paragonimus westermani]|uniref:Uncharacterized protein n=1 Tax=Paragonimus westermani TaxID=34504 RepID=A0A8T0DBH0_9TREM|nr:hypothetical protein P879_11426 [Paragonimus westermani]
MFAVQKNVILCNVHFAVQNVRLIELNAIVYAIFLSFVFSPQLSTKPITHPNI